MMLAMESSVGMFGWGASYAMVGLINTVVIRPGERHQYTYRQTKLCRDEGYGEDEVV